MVDKPFARMGKQKQCETAQDNINVSEDASS